MGNMAPLSQSQEFSRSGPERLSGNGTEEADPLRVSPVEPSDEPVEESERRADSNRSAMDLYLKDPALQRPILDNSEQRALFIRLAEAKTTFSREITQHPLALVYLN